MAAGKLHFKSDAGGITSVSREAGVTNGELVLPASGTVASVSSAVTDNAIARYDSTIGKLQNSAITIDDSGNIGSGTQSFNGFGGSGFKNHIINGNFDVWQRGASGVSTSSFVGPDMWRVWAAGAYTNWSSASSADFAPFSKKVGWGLKWWGDPASSASPIEHRIESINAYKLSGKKLTLSFLAKCSSNTTMNIKLSSANSSDNFIGATLVAQQGVSLTTTTQLFSITFDLTNTDVRYGLNLTIHPSVPAAIHWIAQVQLEEGSIATPFENRPYGLELSLCQRYCFNPKYEAEGSNQVVRGDAYGIDAVNGWVNFKFPVHMRVAPSLYLSDGVSQLFLGYPEAIPLISLSQAIVSCNEAVFAYSVASGNTSNKHYHLYIPNSAHKMLFIAEL